VIIHTHTHLGWGDETGILNLEEGKVRSERLRGFYL